MEFIDLKAQQRRLGSAIDRRIAAVLAHGRYIMGPEVGELEAQLARYVGVRHCISASNGTDALLMPLMALGIGRGDAVFVPAFTFVASAEVVALAGAVPVFVDVEPDTFNIDCVHLEQQVGRIRAAGGLRPRAVIAVDLFGLAAPYDRLQQLCDANGLDLIEDAAQSIGGWRDGRRNGSFGRVAATSFFPAKPLGCYGDGGAIFTDDDALADVLRSIRVHGQGASKYDNVRIGLNGRLDTLQAAILLEKLAILDDEMEARQRVAGGYAERLGNHVAVPAVPPGSRSAWAQYTLRCTDRAAVQASLAAAGVPCAVYYEKPLHRLGAFGDVATLSGALPVAERLCAEVLSLPMHPYLTEADIDQVCTAVRAGARG